MGLLSCKIIMFRKKQKMGLESIPRVKNVFKVIRLLTIQETNQWENYIKILEKKDEPIS